MHTYNDFGDRCSIALWLLGATGHVAECMETVRSAGLRRFRRCGFAGDAHVVFQRKFPNDFSKTIRLAFIGEARNFAGRAHCSSLTGTRLTSPASSEPELRNARGPSSQFPRGDNYENQICSLHIGSAGPGSSAQRKIRSTKPRFSRTISVCRFIRSEPASITVSRCLHPGRSGEGRLLSLGDRKES